MANGLFLPMVLLWNFLKSSVILFNVSEKLKRFRKLPFPAFKCWCQAAWQYLGDAPSERPFDTDVM
jgi:hypothetical protein